MNNETRGTSLLGRFKASLYRMVLIPTALAAFSPASSSGDADRGLRRLRWLLRSMGFSSTSGRVVMLGRRDEEAPGGCFLRRVVYEGEGDSFWALKITGVGETIWRELRVSATTLSRRPLGANVSVELDTGCITVGPYL